MADTHTTTSTTGTSTTGHAGAGHKMSFAPLDPSTFVPQLFWLALAFGLLYLLLKRVALPRVSDVIEERRERIERDIAKAEGLKVETEQAPALARAIVAKLIGKDASPDEVKRALMQRAAE